MTVARSLGLDHDINATFVLLNNRQRSARCLQQRSQLRFNEPNLLIRIAHVAQRRTHVQHSARLAFREHVVAAQVDLRRLACGAQLLQVPVTELALLVLLVANSLRIDDPFGDGRGCSRRSFQLACWGVGSCHSWKRILGITNEHCQMIFSSECLKT